MSTPIPAVQWTYALDANVFIEAKNRYYAFDLAPAFWQALIDHNTAGRIVSVDRIEAELLHLGDDLSTWVQANYKQAFQSTSTAGVMAAYGQLMNWANTNPQFLAIALTEFAASADGWLVAYAKATPNVMVVTHEVFEPAIRKKIKIPNACQAVGVQCCDTFAMLRDLGVRFA